MKRFILAAALVAFPAMAFAEIPVDPPEEPSAETIAEARYRFRQGALSYNSGRFADAIDHFTAAYELSHRDEMLYNLFLAYRDAADTENAVRVLRQYLASGASDQTAAQRDRLEGTLRAMEERLEQANTTPDESTEPSTPPETPMAVPPEPEPEPEPEPAAPDEPAAYEDLPEPPASSRRRFRYTVAGASLLVTGAGAAAFGIAMQVQQGNEEDRLDEACTLGATGDRCPANLDQESIKDDYNRFGALRTVGFALSAASIAGGIVLLVLRPDATAVPTATCSSEGCQVGVTAEF